MSRTELLPPLALAPTLLNSAGERNVITPSTCPPVSLTGARDAQLARAEHLQARSGRARNSISSAQARGAGFPGGLFLVNEEEMASHFTVIAGRGGRFVYSLQRDRLGSTGLVAEAGAGEGTHFPEQNLVVPSHQAGQETRGLLGAALEAAQPCRLSPAPFSN